MSTTRLRTFIRLGIVAALLGAAASVCAASEPRSADDPALARRRAERRAAVRARSLDKDAGVASFGLLVIPVDFADARFPGGEDVVSSLGRRLSGGGVGTLTSYYAAASRGRIALHVVLAPVVHLAGVRADYADIAYGGYARTRALAEQSLAGAAAAGVPFSLADRDGPDGLPGSADDDGFVDGVLILHAAPGVENDPSGGLVVPLQFFLEEPFFSAGTGAQDYAVAAARSGLGVWAHETGHLFGLDDRYDPFLASGGDSAVSRGGLGVFSLMAAGAWGSGDAHDPALLDADSSLLLGWADERVLDGTPTAEQTLPPGVVWRVPAGDANPDEYFLLETRGGTPPWDPELPEPEVLVYHVDAAVPDDAVSTDDGPEHLRVRLVEADGTQDLATGVSNGDLGDVFPGSTGNLDWGPATLPSSAGYRGPSGVACAFAAADDGFLVDLQAPGHLWTAAFAVVPAPGDTQVTITVVDPYRDAAPFHVGLSLDASDPTWGGFAPGVSAVSRDLVETSPGAWELAAPVRWLPTVTPPAGAITHFVLAVDRDGASTATERRDWLWRDASAPLDFVADWPGAWSIVAGGNPATTWFRWSSAAGGPLPQTVLACVGADAPTPADWPDVSYAHDADARLTSAPVRTTGSALRLVHALDAHLREPGLGSDGAVVEAVGPDGVVRPLVPLGGYGGRVARDVGNPLLGRPAFIGPGELDADTRPLWAVDLFALPEVDGGWSRLRLRLASDAYGRGRGWLIADVSLVPVADLERPFRAAWSAADDALRIVWPWETPQRVFVDASADEGVTWSIVWEGAAPAGKAVDMLVPHRQLAMPEFAAGTRILLRARLRLADYVAVSRPAQATAAATLAARLGLPFPNPSAGGVSVLVSVPGTQATLEVYDLRGRRVRRWTLGSGETLVAWDGRDDEGRRAAAGVYLMRLSAADESSARKVTILR